MQMIHRVWPKQNLKIVFHCPRQMHSTEEGRFPHLQGLHQLMLDCFPGGSTHSGSNNLFQPSFIKMRPIMLHLGLNISCWTTFPYKHFLQYIHDWLLMLLLTKYICTLITLLRLDYFNWSSLLCWSFLSWSMLPHLTMSPHRFFPLCSSDWIIFIGLPRILAFFLLSVICDKPIW